MISYPDFLVSLDPIYSAYEKHSHPSMFSSFTAFINGIVVNIVGVFFKQLQKTPQMSEWKQISTK